MRRRIDNPQAPTSPAMSSANIMSASIQNSALANPSATIQHNQPNRWRRHADPGQFAYAVAGYQRLPERHEWDQRLVEEPQRDRAKQDMAERSRCPVAAVLWDLSDQLRRPRLLLMSSSAGRFVGRLSTPPTPRGQQQRTAGACGHGRVLLLPGHSVTGRRSPSRQTIDVCRPCATWATYTQAQIDSDASGGHSAPASSFTNRRPTSAFRAGPTIVLGLLDGRQAAAMSSRTACARWPARTFRPCRRWPTKPG